MKSVIRRIWGFIGTVSVAAVLVSMLGALVLGRPVLMAAVTSNSMYPVCRGDLVFMKGFSQADTIETGDVIVYRTDAGKFAGRGWICHRVVGGDSRCGFLTKGDNNQGIDQECGCAAPVTGENISNEVVTINGQVLRIPLVGYLGIWAEELAAGTCQLLAGK